MADRFAIIQLLLDGCYYEHKAPRACVFHNFQSSPGPTLKLWLSELYKHNLYWSPLPVTIKVHVLWTGVSGCDLSFWRGGGGSSSHPIAVFANVRQLYYMLPWSPRNFFTQVPSRFGRRISRRYAALVNCLPGNHSTLLWGGGQLKREMNGWKMGERRWEMGEKKVWEIKTKGENWSCKVGDERLGERWEREPHCPLPPPLGTALNMHLPPLEIIPPCYMRVSPFGDDV